MSILIVISIRFHILHSSIPETSCCGDELLHGEEESTHIAKVKGHLPVCVYLVTWINYNCSHGSLYWYKLQLGCMRCLVESTPITCKGNCLIGPWPPLIIGLHVYMYPMITHIPLWWSATSCKTLWLLGNSQQLLPSCTCHVLWWQEIIILSQQ